jgi:hypothetical protein
MKLSAAPLTLITCLVCFHHLAVGLAGAQVNVLTANYGIDRTNANLEETLLTPANVQRGSFGKLGVLPADGQVFAQPLYLSGLTIPDQGSHNVLFVATEHNSVYAYDADSADSPTLYWHRNLGPSVPSTLFADAEGAPYTDIAPEVGITSTGTIDLQGGVLYVVAETLVRHRPTFELHALDLATGEERMNGPVTISATFPGAAAGAVNGRVPFDPSQHIQRPGLLLLNGAVYVGFGSHADQGTWHGWLISYNASNLNQQIGVFQATPNGRGGAIWQSGRGLVADDSGNIYIMTGNGDYDGIREFGESFIKLSGTSPVVTDWYTPQNWRILSDNDYDLSAGPVLIPGTRLLVGGDKYGSLYLIQGDNMGHLDEGNSATQVFKAVNGWIFTLALWPQPDAAYVYVQEKNGPLKCYQVVGETFSTEPVSVSNTVGSARVGMAISANGKQPGTGILWQSTGGYADPSTPGILHAFDASNLENELWNSGLDPQDDLNGFVKFVPPTVANGKVFMASSNAVAVYGLLPPGESSDPEPVVTPAQNTSRPTADPASR